MKTTTPNEQYFGHFEELFRTQVHQLLAWGFHDALVRIRSRNTKDQQEPAITGFIVEAIKNRRRALDRPKWVRHYAVYDDPAIEEEGKSGMSRPRADIIIEAAAWSGCPEYLFEAKRLRKTGYGAGKYVGKDGMGCFTSGKYASRYDEAAMLGYVQSDSLEYWQTTVKDAIIKQASETNLINTPVDIRQYRKSRQVNPYFTGNSSFRLPPPG